MDNNEFEKLKTKFAAADVTGKVQMYVSTADLTNGQYRELLALYPIDKLNILEEALG